jgi:aspartate/methionine/tyrosine aminotransferase
MVNPPKDGDASYEQYNKERTSILESLKRRATVLAKGLNEMEGVSCNVVEGALYAFPSITLPPKAVEAAAAAGKAADAFYCLRLLDETGVVVVPGSGFGQSAGTFHFRTTILPPEDKMLSVVGKMSDFHKKFMDQYR